jgi:hypothetical protein
VQKLQREISKYKEEIEDLNEFKLQKADVENELEEIKQSRENERKKQKDKLYELEREVVKEKDRLKKEMEVMLQDQRNKLLDLAHSRLEAVLIS